MKKGTVSTIRSPEIFMVLRSVFVFFNKSPFMNIIIDMSVLLYKVFGSRLYPLYTMRNNKIITMTSIITPQDKIDFLEACRDDPVFFVESLMYAENSEPYILEKHQKEFLRCPESYRMLFWARRLSKSTTLRFDILHKTFFEPNLRALVTLPSWSQANDFGKEIQDLAARSPLISEMFTKMGNTTMALQNSSRIDTASAGKEGVSQLGRGVRYLAFDEAQQIPDRVYGFLIPVMRGTPGKKYQVFSGTPLGKMGMFWEVYNDAKMYVKDGKVKKMEVEDPLTGEQFVVFQRQTAYIDDEGSIIRSGTKRVQIPELITDRKRMGEIDFLREYCLQWMDTIGQVFPKTLIEDCEKVEKTIFTSSEECVVGIDLGKQRNNSVITVGRVKNDHKMEVIFIKSFELGTDYKTIIDYLTKVIPRKFPGTRKIVMDKTGVGDPVVESVERILRGTGIKVEGFNFAGIDKKNGLVENGVVAMEKGEIKFFHHQKLITEMLSYKRVINEKTNRISYSKPHGGTDDYVDSFLLCVGAFKGLPGGMGPFRVVSVGAQALNKYNPFRQSRNINPRYQRGRR